jgi:cytochrome c5
VFNRNFRVLIQAMVLLGAASAAHAFELTEEQRAEIEARISPVGEVCLQGDSCGGLPPGSMGGAGAIAAVDGEGTYNMACMACHASGAGGAPIVGNIDIWAPRIAKGAAALHASGVNGVAGTSMMAKGGRSDISDEAIIAAVDYMITNSQ